MSLRLLLVLILTMTALPVAAVLPDADRPIVPLAAEPIPDTYAEVEAQPRSWAVLNADGQPIGEQPWRIVNELGNCCENLLLAAPTGRLLSWGDEFISFSDDDGQTWMEVPPPLAACCNGEGAMAMAPDGDVVGITWLPYEGDRAFAMRHDAQSDTWTYAEHPTSVPFYDRPWFATVATADGDWFGVAKGGNERVRDLLHYADDGVVYDQIGSMRADSNRFPPREGPLPTAPDASADWTQPHAETGVVPLGGGYAFGNSEFFYDAPLVANGDPVIELEACESTRRLMTPDRRWHCYDGGEPVVWQAMDSDGVLHAVEWSPTGTLTHRTSQDGGVTVQDLELQAPPGTEWQPDVDLMANAALDTVVIAAAARQPDGVGQHVVIRVTRDIAGQWVHESTLLVGDGDLNYSSGGFGGVGERFDFASVALLPDGRVALSFNDLAHLRPAVAIQLG